MALSQPTVRTAHFKQEEQQPRVLRYWRSGYSGPVKTVQNTPMPIRVHQSGICSKDQTAAIIAPRGDPTQLVTNLDALHCGKLGSCWMVDSNVEAIQTGNQKADNDSTKLLRYWIIWEQDYYQAPT